MNSVLVERSLLRGPVSRRLLRVLGVAAGLLIALHPVRADDPQREGAPSSGVASVPGGDIFGFTASTDVGKVGDHGAGVEMDGAFGARNIRYNVLRQKFYYERVIAPDTSLGLSVFTALHSIGRLPGEPPNRTFAHFDGFGFELAHRLFERSAGNPFAFKVAIEPRWARLSRNARHTSAFGAELKLIADAAVVPDKLFWAGNLVFGFARERDIILKSKYENSSILKVSNALTWQFSERLFAGVEVAYIAAFEGFYHRLAGQAVFAGPTLYWKFAKNASLNVTIAPQIAGRVRGVPQRLDLDNFERVISRAKLSVEF
jgi:hypothetical protein